MEGWIKLHRVLIEKPIWTTSNCFQRTLLVTLLLLANHRGNEWEWKGEKYKVRPGQFVTSLPSLQKLIGKEATEQKLRTALKRFEKYNFLTDETTNKNRLITIVNWELYQANEEDNNGCDNGKITGNQQAVNRQLTPNKNDNNANNDKEAALPFLAKWQSEFGMPFLSPIAQSDLEIIADKYSYDWFCRAVDIAKKKNAKSPRYIMPIMEEWQHAFNTTGNQTPWKKLSQADQSRLTMKKIAEAEHDEGTSSGTLKDGGNGSQFDLGDW